MSHRVKIEDVKNTPKKTELELHHEKTEHLSKIEDMLNSLKGERVKENQLTDAIINQEAAVQSIQRMLDICNQNPNAKPFRMFPGNWAFEYPSRTEAIDTLMDDRRKITQQLTVLKTQRKMARERQVEIINAMGKHTKDIVSLDCFNVNL